MWITFQFQSGQYYWSLPGFTPNQLSITTLFAPCLEENNETDFVVTCQNISCNESNIVVSSLALKVSLDKNVSFAVIRRKSDQDELQSAFTNIMIQGNFTLLKGGALVFRKIKNSGSQIGVCGPPKRPIKGVTEFLIALM